VINQSYIKSFKTYLTLERSLSGNSVDAYLTDIDKLFQYFKYIDKPFVIKQINNSDLKSFISWINELGMLPSTQARIISGLKSFFGFLLLENLIDVDPTELLEAPRLSRKLPDTLNIHEIDALMDAIDVSKPEGVRSKAMIEVLYGCGLRVSELLSLRLSNVNAENGFIKVIGKGNKERIIPIGNSALKYINIYVTEVRRHIPIKKGFEDLIFLNRLGSSLSRISAFTMIKSLAIQAGLNKVISPHTFRHSFATHLIHTSIAIT